MLGKIIPQFHSTKGGNDVVLHASQVQVVLRFLLDYSGQHLGKNFLDRACFHVRGPS